MDRQLAETYAGWFRALADATRVQILNLLAERGEPLTVGQIVEQVPVGQSTVSAHLKALAETRFVLVDRRGTASWYRVNQRCVSRFPTAADVVMGIPPTAFQPLDVGRVVAGDEPGAGDNPDHVHDRAAVPLGGKDNGIQIMPMTVEHAEQTLTIYQAGLDTGDASFETTAPTWEQWDASHLPVHRFVALDRSGKVLGWIAASLAAGRCVYSGVLEHGVYVHPEHRGRGVGRSLLAAYVAATEAAGIWTLQSGVFPENTASLALHRHAGFRVVGRRERIGRHRGQWRDVLLIERRTDSR